MTLPVPSFLPVGGARGGGADFSGVLTNDGIDLGCGPVCRLGIEGGFRDSCGSGTGVGNSFLYSLMRS